MANNPYDDVLEGLKQTAEGLIAANEGIKRTVTAALSAKGEYEDLRETVHRLEALVMAQGDELKKMREDLRRFEP